MNVMTVGQVINALNRHKKVVQIIAIIKASVTMVFVLVITDIQEKIVVRECKEVVQVIAITEDSVTMVFVLVMTDIQEKIVVREKIKKMKMEAVQITVATKDNVLL